MFLTPLRKNCAESNLYINAIKPFMFYCNVHNFPQSKFVVRFLSSNPVCIVINQTLIDNFEKPLKYLL